MKVDIGISINHQKLMVSKLLAVANSGGGKSWLLRKLMEELFGKSQIIIIDTEGEFYTLREKYDFLLFGNGEGNDYSVDIRYAEKMATTLLQLGVSAIIDLYELPPKHRILFVQRFLDACTDAPKKLWHPCIFLIDEAHNYAPEKESAESLQAVNRFVSLGRKRGFCPIIATQRFSKLNKDTSAECNNMLIGRFVQDVDRKRASEQLGFTTREQSLSLRELEPGEFYGFGPAVGDKYEITKFKVGSVKTTHLEAGMGNLVPTPPPTERMKKILEKITEIPKEAEKERKDYEDLRRENINLKTKITQLEKKEKSKEADELRIENLELRDENNGIKITLKEGIEINEKLLSQLKKINDRIKVAAPLINETISKIVEDFMLLGLDTAELRFKEMKKSLNASNIKPRGESIVKTLRERNANLVSTASKESYKYKIEFLDKDNREVKIDPRIRAEKLTNQPRLRPNYLLVDNNLQLGKGERLVLIAIAQHPEGVDKEQITVLTGYKRSSRDQYLQRLSQNGLCEVDKSIKGANIFITENGQAALGNDYNPLPTGGELREYWLNRLGGGERTIFELIINEYPEPITRDEISEKTEYKRSSRDQYLQRLAQRKLVNVLSGKRVKASDKLF